MRLEILTDQAVSPNLAASDPATTCAYPLTALLKDGAIATVYRQGETKHSHDGILVMQLSTDGGRTWSAQRVVFDGRGLTPTQTAVSAGMCQTADDTLLVTFSTVVGLPAGLYMFSEAGLRLRRQLCYSRSEDLGQTWSTPERFELPWGGKAGITTRPFTLPDGTLCMPIEFKTAEGPNGTAMAFSNDGGHSFADPMIVAADPHGRLNLCDARFTRLPDGRLLALLWTFVQDSEETIEVRRAYSSDNGKMWSEPVSVGFVGQITAPLALPSGDVLAASNYRHPPDGIRLWHSSDAGATWNVREPFQMWDLEQRCILGAPITVDGSRHAVENVWDALAVFSFGTPDLQRLHDGSILLTYYATLDGITHIRACRFRVTL